MPLARRSVASRLASQASWSSSWLRRLSRSGSTASWIRPPSVRERGGVSSRVWRSLAASSASSGQGRARACSGALLGLASWAASRGRRSRPSARATRSRADAVPAPARPARRSRSAMGRSSRRTARRRGRPATSSLTPPWRLRMAARSTSGASIQRRRQRPPMAVWVRSSAQSRDPCSWPPSWVRVSSRLRRVAASSTRASPVCQLVGRSRGTRAWVVAGALLGLRLVSSR